MAPLYPCPRSDAPRTEVVVHAHAAGTRGRLPPRGRGRLELQREPLLQLLRPGVAGHGRLGADGQPAQRGLRRDDGVPLPARRAGRLHVQAAAHRRPRRARRRRPALRGGRAVRGAPRHLRRQGVRARQPARDGRSRHARSRTTRIEPCADRSQRSRRSRSRGAANPSGRRARSSPSSIPRSCSPAATPSSTWRSPARSAVGDETLR